MDRALLQPLTSVEEVKVALIETLEQSLRRFERTKLYRYSPYPKQREFHQKGGDPTVYERLLMAANQVGKTLSAAMETATHLTGDYPAWWDGARWEDPTTGWAASNTSQTTRDSVQRLLLGKPGEWGTGAIPGEAIVEIRRASGGVPDCVDSVTVRHKSGGLSRLTFKTYDQGRERWQSETLDFVWLDEEPPYDIYFEAKTRTNAVQGIVYLTFTPLMGMSQTVKRFLIEKVPGTCVISMTIEDAGHYSPEDRARIIASYPEHERKARAQGLPVLGSGAVYPVLDEAVTIAPFPIPRYFRRIVGMDFGWDHPTAAAWLAHDADTDVLYLYDAYKCRQQTPVIHAAAIKGRGAWIPIAWPHDGVAHEKNGGLPLADQYRDQGLLMLPEKATHDPEPGQAEGTGGYNVEAGIISLLDRMQTGRFKVFSHLQDFFEEKNLYHRKNGLIVKEDDDLLDAVRTGAMMLRFAKPFPRPKVPSRQGGFRVLDRDIGY